MEVTVENLTHATAEDAAARVAELGLCCSADTVVPAAVISDLHKTAEALTTNMTDHLSAIGVDYTHQTEPFSYREVASRCQVSHSGHVLRLMFHRAALTCDCTRQKKGKEVSLWATLCPTPGLCQSFTQYLDKTMLLLITLVWSTACQAAPIRLGILTGPTCSHDYSFLRMLSQSLFHWLMSPRSLDPQRCHQL